MVTGRLAPRLLRAGPVVREGAATGEPAPRTLVHRDGRGPRGRRAAECLVQPAGLAHGAPHGRAARARMQLARNGATRRRVGQLMRIPLLLVMAFLVVSCGGGPEDTV